MNEECLKQWKDSFEKLEAILSCAICCNPLKHPTLLITCCHIFFCKGTASLQFLCAIQVPNICRIVELLSKIREVGIFQSYTSGVPLSRNNKRPLREWNEQRNLSLDWKSAKFSNKANVQSVVDKDCEDSTICILPTGLDAKQYTFLKKVIAKLGRAYLATSFHTQVTHVITGHYQVEEKVKRTMKLCMGMVNRCKILSFEWLIHCHMASDWINTLDFEMRETRVKPGALFSHEHFFLEEYKGQVPSKYELEQLITLGGGQITTECA
ncbi:hypothetical protein Gasu2_07750 [Galdieria sulphuraria]|nr:hypothetical protein Gasu2_07750 [Galdieria sulphuraria]